MDSASQWIAGLVVCYNLFQQSTHTELAVMNQAYVVGQISVKNPLKWNEYRDLVPATLEPWGAQIVFRGKKAADFALDNAHPDIVVIQFPDLEAARQWEASSAYQAIIPLRQAAADVMLTAYQA